MEWEPYDPSWLVDWLREHRPSEPELASAAAVCTRAIPEDPNCVYLRFVDTTDANKPGGDWQWDTNILLEGTPRGLVLLVMLEGGRIGGIEFVDEIPSSPGV